MNEEKIIVAFLTGQSDPSGNALSPSQREFLFQSPVPRHHQLDLNFPYRPSAEWRSTPLLKASLCNARQYLGSRVGSFPRRYREPFLETFGGFGKVILLAGSCGLELLVNLRLPEEFLRRLHVFAYGPVSRSVPRCATLWIVQGRGDVISKRWHRKADHVISCGHMDYLESGETAALFARFHHEVAGGADAAP